MKEIRLCYNLSRKVIRLESIKLLSGDAVPIIDEEDWSVTLTRVNKI